MRKDWPVRHCVICGDMITHYTRTGKLMDGPSYRERQSCNNPSCFAENRGREYAKRQFKYGPKKCEKCTRMVPIYWPSGKAKGKEDFDKQRFCSDSCRSEWSRAKGWCVLIKSVISIPARNSPIDKFIYQGQL